MPMSPDPHRELHVFWHDGHSLGVDGTEVGVLKEADKVRLRTFLQGKEVKRPFKNKNLQGGECANLDAEGLGILLHKTPGQAL